VELLFLLLFMSALVEGRVIARLGRLNFGFMDVTDFKNSRAG
jgi:hypothetical protein